jgi:hypothetical protein
MINESMHKEDIMLNVFIRNNSASKLETKTNKNE